MEEYIILSPDGFPIDHKTYTEDEILQAFNEWKSFYVEQGYYSSVSYGKIPLYELEDYCTTELITKQ